MSALGEFINNTFGSAFSCGQSKSFKRQQFEKNYCNFEIWRRRRKTLHGQIFFPSQTAKCTKQVVFVFFKCKKDNLIPVTTYHEEYIRKGHWISLGLLKVERIWIVFLSYLLQTPLNIVWLVFFLQRYKLKFPQNLKMICSFIRQLFSVKQCKGRQLFVFLIWEKRVIKIDRPRR